MMFWKFEYGGEEGLVKCIQESTLPRSLAHQA